MAATMRTGGLHHASSLGNIDTSSQAKVNFAARSYDSEDENMGRKKGRPFETGPCSRAPVYSKGDIREQYCLTDRQLNSIEQPRRERFFGCWSGRNAPQSFLGVCVGRRAPSDENLADYAPMQRYPRYINSGPIAKSILQQYDDDMESSYFRRKPTSFLSNSGNTGVTGGGGPVGGGGAGGGGAVGLIIGSSATLPGAGDSKRYGGSWLPAEDEAVRLEGPSLYRCPAHNDLLPPPPPPPNVGLIDGIPGGPPRTKHVSFARSYTLTSFDEAMGSRPLSRLAAARSQERLIGGKKPTITLAQHTATPYTSGAPLHSILTQPTAQQPLLPQALQKQPLSVPQNPSHNQPQQQQQQPQQLPQQQQPQQPQHVLIQQQPTSHLHQHLHQQHLQHLQHQQAALLAHQVHLQHQHQQQQQQQHQQQQQQQAAQQLAAQQQQQLQHQQEMIVLEKVKRSAMKTQATQTEVYLGKKGAAPHNLSLSPRTIHRVKMVSQGAQTNGGLNGGGRKLTKSLSEAGDRIQENGIDPTTVQPIDTGTNANVNFDHELLHRTQSEEPPKSPFTITSPPASHVGPHFELPSSRTSSQLSHSDGTHLTHSRNHSQDSATSYRSTDGSRTSYETASYPYDAYDSIVLPRRASHAAEPTFQFLRKQDLEQVHHHHQQQQQRHQQQQQQPQQQHQQTPHQSQYTHGYENGYVPFETHSLPRRTCIHHKPEEFHTHTLPRRDHGHTHHHHEIVYRDQSHPTLPAPEHLILSNGSVNQDVRSFDSTPSAPTTLNRRMSAHAIVLPPEKQHSSGLPLVQGLHQQQQLQQQQHQQQQQQQRRASYAFVTPDTHALAKRNSIPHQQIQKVQPIMQAQFATPVKQQPFQPLVKPQPPVLPSHYTTQTAPPSCPVTPPNIQPLDMQDDTKSSSEGSCSTCESESEQELDGHGEEQEIFIDFKPRVSPVPSPGAVKKKKLQKAQSEGELAHAERRKTSTGDGDGGSSTVPTASDDEGRSTMREQSVPQLPTPDYRDASESSVADDEPQQVMADRRKENFRKRSVSLDQPTSCEQDEDDELPGGPATVRQQTVEDARSHGHVTQRMSSRSRSIGAAIGSRHLSAPPSPQKEDQSASTGKLHREVSPFHSSDSLANDVTRDTSDGNWNESQATIMTTSLTDNGKLTPSSRRKNLLLQHQQRSSMDTDALDMEDIADQPLPPLPVTVASTALQTNLVSTPCTLGSHQQQPNGTAIQPTGIVKPTTPSIAVIPSPSMEREERDLQWQKTATLRRPSRPLSPTKRAARNEQLQQKQQKLQKIEPLIHRSSDPSDRTNKPDSSPTSSIAPGSGGPTTPQQSLPASAKLPHHHPMTATTPVAARFTKGSPGNGVDLLKDHPVLCQDPASSGGGGGGGGGAVSEGSTTEDYVTCTDNSKRGVSGAKATTQDGSSFESASSIYSLARVDAVCEETPPIEEKSVSPQIPPPPIPKPSPTHSVSSSSSDSFSVSKKSSPSRPALPKAIAGKVKTSKPQSLSDDERSEKRYSSSHDEKEAVPKVPYSGSATGTIARSARRGRDWNEEERRRKKSTFKLEFDKDSIKTYTTPMLRQPSPGFKKLSPEDKSALNVLDGASPSSKQKRFRQKTRKSPRARSAVPEETGTVGAVGTSGTLPRRSKTPLVRSPEKPTTTTTTTTTAVVLATPQPTIVTPSSKLSPSQYYSQIRSPPTQSPRKQKISPEKRLQAISTESLRSVSPGSDSVFYSEADALSHCEQQVHCSHCGKEVEVANLPGESEESILTLDSTDNDRPDIVQPPEGFADSPDCAKTPHHTTRLYKKMDKRFRSEDRHVDRRHFKSRQEYRAKSEERSKEEIEQNNLRPAGSSPCVAPAGQAYIDTTSEPEQGIYHGNYKAGLWICIADRDVWRRHELPDGSFDRSKDATLERRGSTDSERDFRKKYQAITHRLVHRKSCVEMYRRQNSNSFDTDKTVVVCRKSGEFGFRIHGSKPVVVSAIEPDTPAETSGLEVGDIVLSVNGISVIDKSHSEVVKIAHAGSDTLELEVARTIGVLSPLEDGSSHPSIYTGFLWRYCASGGKWVRRWFSLRPDHCLYYYKSDTDNQPIGAIMLTNHTIERIPLEPTTRPYSFAIDTEEGTKVQLSADSEEAASRWIAIISHAAQQCDPWLENSARNLRLSATGISKPDCSGPLTKLGSKWRSWTKRYCVLKDAVLYFYHDGTSKSAFGMACLQGYRVQPSSAGGKKYAFEIVPPELSLRHYYFHTETEMDKKRWVAALEYSIDRWMRAG
ncbi:uncharacterized protein LOC126563742 isoform X2 [Anopheles maculipalpis]|uniref:uncharacterized protein LOC126563742 isoform X2 n=1 Tax=Anopheles maculipalpis TaxID=1496333 RepID=UPI0021596D45|nr:uncharacterized protein LOC126563742 isoform X2 [Anopheles maculipalpis]